MNQEQNALPNLIPVSQTPDDLVLGVMNHAPALDLTILKQAQINHAGLCLTFAIIGESHFVQIRDEKQVLWQEMLACVPLSATFCLHHYRFQHGKSHCYQTQGYQIKLWSKIIAYKNASASASYEQGDNKNNLTVAFPLVKQITPITNLQWTVQNATVHWKTTHTYPMQNGITYVYTTSSFRV